MRYLKNLETGQIVVVTHDDQHIGNGHALVLASDPEAAPAAGWVESTEAEYDAALASVEEAAAEALAVSAQAMGTAAAKLAELGFTHVERMALGLP